MKKTLLVVAVLLCAFALFAADNSVTFGMVPCSVQILTSSDAPQSPAYSKYGFGEVLSYQRFLVNGFFAEGGLSWNTFWLKKDSTAYSNLMVFAGLGYKQAVAPHCGLFVHADVAEDTVFYQNKAQAEFAVKTGVGVGLSFWDNWDINIACDRTFGFCGKDGKSYVDYRIQPTVGVTYQF